MWVAAPSHARVWLLCLSADGRLVVHYSPVGVPGNGQDVRFQKWTRAAFDAASADLGGFQIMHIESLPVWLPDFDNITIPVVPSWHGIKFDNFREIGMAHLFNDELIHDHCLGEMVTMAHAFREQALMFKRYFKYHIVLSERARMDFTRVYGIRPQRTVVIHHSMPVTKYKPAPDAGDAFRARWGVPTRASAPPGTLVIGFACMFTEVKGVYFMMQVLPHLLALSEVRACMLAVAPGAGGRGWDNVTPSPQ